MKKTIIVLFITLLVMIVSSCSCTKKSSNGNTVDNKTVNTIETTIAKNYFFKNDVSTPENKEEFIIKTQEEFDRYFSPAAFMGKDGEVTKIDFNKQVALCVVLGETPIDKRLGFVDVKPNEDNGITYTYSLTIGKKIDYNIRPCLIVLIDKKLSEKGVEFHRLFVR